MVTPSETSSSYKGSNGKELDDTINGNVIILTKLLENSIFGAGHLNAPQTVLGKGRGHCIHFSNSWSPKVNF